MPSVTAGEVFGINWADLEQVKALADKFGPGMAVIKYPGRLNYNIKHTNHTPTLKPGYIVLYET